MSMVSGQYKWSKVRRDTKPQYSLFMDEHYLLPRFQITLKVEQIPSWFLLMPSWFSSLNQTLKEAKMSLAHPPSEHARPSPHTHILPFKSTEDRKKAQGLTIIFERRQVGPKTNPGSHCPRFVVPEGSYERQRLPTDHRGLKRNSHKLPVFACPSKNRFTSI